MINIARLSGLCLLACVFVGEVAAQASSTLEGKVYRLVINSQVSPMPINQIHAWKLHLTDAQGKPVSGASIRVLGGMPAHNHGLPTAPRVTKEMAVGEYFLEGMKFHMGGEWEVHFDIVAPSGEERLSLSFEL